MHFTHIIQKGTDPTTDSYSGFADNGGRIQTGLDGLLRFKGIDTLYICGLATDYCVKYTVLDALSRGYTVYLIVDGCRGVNQHFNDSQKSILEMEKAGAHLIASIDVPKSQGHSMNIFLCLFGAVYAHGPDSSSFDELDAFRLHQMQSVQPQVFLKRVLKQEADYTIHVKLDPDTKRIEGSETIVYTNNSPDTLHYVWIQLDPNYLSKLSARGRMQTAPHLATENAIGCRLCSSLRDSRTPEPNLEIFNVKVNGEANTPIIRDTQMRLSLPTPLESTEELTIELEWSYTMNDASVVWARSGYEILEDESIIFGGCTILPKNEYLLRLRRLAHQTILRHGRHGVWRLRCLHHGSKGSYRRFNRCASEPRRRSEFGSTIKIGKSQNIRQTYLHCETCRSRTESNHQYR